MCTGSWSDWTEELCVRLAFCPELQLVIVVGKISGFRNCLQTAPYATGSRKANIKMCGSSQNVSFCFSEEQHNLTNIEVTVFLSPSSFLFGTILYTYMYYCISFGSFLMISILILNRPDQTFSIYSESHQIEVSVWICTSTPLHFSIGKKG
jgi:hypothetical protein